jgi:hypothetical protein
MQVNADFKDLFAVLNAEEAEFLVVGGYAFSYHAFPRFTKDLDIWVHATLGNSARVYRALHAFGAPLHDLEERELAEEGLIFQMGVPPNRVDILTSIDGVQFSDAWEKLEP